MLARIFCTLTLLALISAVHSNKQDAPFYIQSGHAKLYQDKQLIIHEQNVKIDYGDSHLFADKVNSYFDDNNKITKALAFGNSKQQSHYWNNIDPDKPDFHAYADLIEYLLLDEKLIIHKDNVKIEHGCSHLTAHQVNSYFDDNNKITKAFAIGDTKQQPHYWNSLDPDKPDFHAYADLIEYLPLEENLIIHKDNVKIEHGCSHLTAHRVNSYFDDNNKLVKSIAYSSRKNQSHFWNNSDPNKPVLHAYADFVEYLPLEDNTIIHKDNVIMHNGASHLTAKQINSYLDNNNKLIKSIAYRSEEKQSHYWEDNNPKDKDSEFHAYADLIEYLYNEDIVILKGDVTIKNAQGTHISEKVRYNLKTKKMFSNSKQGEKVVMLFEVS